MLGDGGTSAGTVPERAQAPIVREARSTVRNWLPYFLAVMAFWFAVLIIGAAVGTERGSPVIPVRSPGDPVPALDPLSLFLHNSQIAALVIVGTVFVLPSIVLIGYNAFLLGASMADAIASLGPIATFSILLPHAIFELPAFLLAGAISLRWMHVAWQTTQGGDRRVSVGRTVTETVLAIVAVVFLLGIAAIVEGTITKQLAESLT